MKNLTLLFVVLLASMVFYANSNAVHAHPEDDFCGPDSGIDPQLCRQLSELNSSEGSVTHPLLDEEGKTLSALGSAWYFLKIGVQHILPGGTDHILFVLALCLASRSLRRLAVQISVFTVAHTVTLGLTAAGVIEPPASVVEPLIALSIAVVAIENLYAKTEQPWRLLIIFAFGLFHGMGFAGFIREIGLPVEQFWPSLIGFNIGVEIGQLAVVFAALLVALPIKRIAKLSAEGFQRTVVRPVSLLIAAIGLYWFFARVLY